MKKAKKHNVIKQQGAVKGPCDVADVMVGGAREVMGLKKKQNKEKARVR